jgi:U1 small nuclear ribonucleoprotein C
VRKTHCAGRKHKENVKAYYQQWMEDQAQSLIDATTAAFKSGRLLKPAATPAYNGIHNGSSVSNGLPSLISDSNPVLSLSQHQLSLGPPPGLPQGLPPGLLPGPTPGMPPGMTTGLPPGMTSGLPPGMTSGLAPGAMTPQPHVFSHSLPPLLSHQPHQGFFGPLFHPAFRPPMGLVIFRPNM